MSQILAAKPHSADVERCIGANSLLNPLLRVSLKVDTENLCLFMHHNLPPANSRPSMAEDVSLAKTQQEGQIPTMSSAMLMIRV